MILETVYELRNDIKTPNMYVEFRRKIVKNSENKFYDIAIHEWSLHSYYKGESYCICGHHVHNQYIIKNVLNDNKLIVGCVCIGKIGNGLLVDELKFSTMINNLYKYYINPDQNSGRKTLDKTELSILVNRGYISPQCSDWLYQKIGTRALERKNGSKDYVYLLTTILRIKRLHDQHVTSQEHLRKLEDTRDSKRMEYISTLEIQNKLKQYHNVL